MNGGLGVVLALELAPLEVGEPSGVGDLAEVAGVGELAGGGDVDGEPVAGVAGLAGAVRVDDEGDGGDFPFPSWRPVCQPVP